MNQIYWDVDRINILTDTMDASIHRHAMMQFFVCTEGKLDIKVGKEKPDAKCILVNKNVKHSFKADNSLCLTTIIEPVSTLGLALDVLLENKDYYIVDESTLAPESRVSQESLLDDLKIMLEQLRPKERDILILRFGLNNDGNKKTLDEIGSIYGVSRERIRQIENRAISKLKKLCKNKNLTSGLKNYFGG